jgi:hypothetical protein
MILDLLVAGHKTNVLTPCSHHHHHHHLHKNLLKIVNLQLLWRYSLASRHGLLQIIEKF